MNQAIHAGCYFASRLGGGGATGAQFLDELLAASFQHLGGPVKDLSAVVTRASGPSTAGSAGGDDGFPTIFSGGAAGVGQKVSLGVRYLDGSSRLGTRKGAPEVQLVCLCNYQSVLVLGILHCLPLPADFSST